MKHVSCIFAFIFYHLKNFFKRLSEDLIYYLFQSGYIDGPVLRTFRMNLVILPMVMDYMQYIFIGLGLCFIIGAVALQVSKKVHLNDQ